VASNRIAARPLPAVTPPPAETDPDLLHRYLEDAAHFPGGHALAVVRPSSIEEVAAAITAAARALVVGAQSSLTGGATPSGDVVISTERLRTVTMAGERVIVGPGVTLESLQQQLAVDHRWLPPVPTFLGATAGGAASTNAAGAATFKYGTMRNWIEGIALVLPDGELLELHRGEVSASESGRFELTTARGTTVIARPDIRMPDVPKCSAGYYSAPGMDLVDLFVGSEGTLGAIVSVTFRVAPRPSAVCWALVPVPEESRAIALVEALRRAAQETWRKRDPRGVDVAAIEHIDRRALDILKEDGVDRRLNVTVPAGTAVVLLVQVELSAAAAARDLWSDISNARAADAPDTPLVRFCRLLDDHAALEDTELVLPDDATRRAALVEFREATPASVNRRVALAQAQVDRRIHKTAADSVVAFDRFADMMATCRRLFAERGVDLAVWGHISDGNVHPNVVPRSYADIEAGKAIMLELGREVIAMGGSPLAEHGVGRSPMKQQLLQMLYGEEGIASMQRVKHAIDRRWKLARGVLFPVPSNVEGPTPSGV
jgi:D-lactate dehydrogenase (cytochrome)